MVARLVIISGPDKGKTFPLIEGDSLLIGRSRATETRLTDPHVSRVHCQVQVDRDRAVVSDFESGSGTFVNGKQIVQQPLQPGDIIKIGGTELRFEQEDIAEKTTWLGQEGPGKKTPEPEMGSLGGLVGQKLSHYEVGPVLARGRTGHVFRARDSRDGQPAALKVLSPEFTRDEKSKQRFVRAMKTMLPLRHPNLVALLGAGKKGSFCWLAMELVEGESLTQVIQRIGIAGMLDWRNAFRIAVHIGRALQFAHENQIIHRNIAPPNILIRSSDKVAKLGDLMLAKALQGGLAQQITRPGDLVGDVRYMAPERTHGDAQVDGRADIYGLGATVYALLTGRPPFEAAILAETIQKIRHEAPVPVKKFHMAIPDLFAGIVMNMIAKRPEDRYQKAADLLTELKRVATLQGIQD